MHGITTPPLPDLRRPIWESHGRALLYGAGLDRAGIISNAYSSIADLAAIVEEPGRDFTRGDDAAAVEKVFEAALHALVEVMRLSGLSDAEATRRVRAIREMTVGR